MSQYISENQRKVIYSPFYFLGFAVADYFILFGACFTYITTTCKVFYVIFSLLMLASLVSTPFAWFYAVKDKNKKAIILLSIFTVLLTGVISFLIFIFKYNFEHYGFLY